MSVLQLQYVFFSPKWFQKLLDMLTLERLISLPHLQMGCIHNTRNLFCSFTCTPIKQSNLSTFVGFLKSEVPAALLGGPSHQTNKCQAHGLEIGMTTMPMMSKQQWDSILWSYFCLHKVLISVLGISLLQRKNWWVRFGYMGPGIWTLELMDMQEWIDWRSYSELLLLNMGPCFLLLRQTNAFFIGELTLHWKYVSNEC
jgi:hypothetical protein